MMRDQHTTLETSLRNFFGNQPRSDGYDLRLGLVHDFVTPNEPMAVRLISTHRRDVDYVVACDETERKEATGEEPSLN